MRLFLPLLLLASTALAQPKTFVVIFDEGATPEAVIFTDWSLDPATEYQGRTDVLIDPDLSAVEETYVGYWKHVAGALVVMTALEQQAVDDALTQTEEEDSTGAGDRICLIPVGNPDINSSPNNRRIDDWQTRGSVSTRTFKHDRGISTNPGDVCVKKNGTVLVDLYACVDGGANNHRSLFKIRRNDSPFNWAKVPVEEDGCGGRSLSLIVNDGDCFDIVVDRDSGNGATVTTRSQQTVWCMAMLRVEP